MNRKSLLHPVLQLYSLERNAVSSIYTQGGLLLTATIALAVGLYNSLPVAHIKSMEPSYGRDLLLLLGFATVVSLICAMWNISKGLVPTTKYPSNKIHEVVSILRDGERNDERVQKAEEALERILSEASDIYQQVTEARSIHIRKSFIFVISSSVLLGMCVFCSWLIGMYAG